MFQAIKIPILASTLWWAGCSTTEPRPIASTSEAIVGDIDGTPIVAAELRRQLDIEQTRAFVNSQGAARISFDEVTRRAVEAIAERRMTRVVLAEHGLLTDTSYDGFLRRWAAENQRRADGPRSEPTYGPLFLEEADFERYELDAARAAYVEAVRTTFDVDDARLRAEYEVVKDRFFRAGVTADVTMYAISYDETTRASARVRLEAMRAGLVGGQRSPSVHKDVRSVTTSYEGTRRDPIIDPFRVEALRLTEGEIGEVIDGHGQYVFFQSIGRRFRYIPFTAAKAFLVETAIRDQLEASVRARVASAKVHIDRDLVATALGASEVHQ